MVSFEEKVRTIFHYIAEFGIQKMPIHKLGRVPTESEKQKYKALVHFGFRLGQNKIVEEIVSLQKEHNDIKGQVKEVNKIKDKEGKIILLERLHAIEYDIQVLRHFADFIAWQIIGGHHFKARAMYSGSRSRPDLLNTNLNSVLLSVEQFHLINPMSFGLITDLTTFVDVGDILWVDDESVRIVEVKTGQTQKKVNELIQKLVDLNHTIVKDDLDGITRSMLDQAERNIEQLRKGSVVKSFINEEKGADPFTGDQRNVIETLVHQKRYFDQLEHLLDAAIKDGEAFGSIEDIINIGVFKPERIPSGLDISKSSHIVIEKTILTDYVTQLFVPISEPLFFKPIGREHLFNLLFGKLKVIVSIDLDKLMSFFNEGGLKTVWLSTKESFKYKDQKKTKNRPFFLNNRVIQIQSKNLKLVLGDQFLIRLLYDNLTPSAMRQTYLDIRHQTSKA